MPTLGGIFCIPRRPAGPAAPMYVANPTSAHTPQSMLSARRPMALSRCARASTKALAAA